MPMQKIPPSRVRSYRQRSGYAQAIVTLTDADTRQRRDYWLGEFDTPESRERYHRLIAEWERNGRRLPPQNADATPSQRPDAITVVEVIFGYWRWAIGYYRPKHTQALDGALSLLREVFGRTPAIEFGPKMLRLLRDLMIRGVRRSFPTASRMHTCSARLSWTQNARRPQGKATNRAQIAGKCLNASRVIASPPTRTTAPSSAPTTGRFRRRAHHNSPLDCTGQGDFHHDLFLEDLGMNASINTFDRRFLISGPPHVYHDNGTDSLSLHESTEFHSSSSGIRCARHRSSA
ncbi:MAG: hypothetical protein SF069_18860 [Phycisphaerae bacterium]|nr:hypothetical protein [Phycisphaerae bacterium]